MRAPQKLQDAATAPFWDGLRQSTLRLPKCRECGHLLFPIGPCCSNCLSTESDWVKLSGKGQVWSYIVYHHAFDPAFADKLPYNVALVLLDEGPRLLTNIVGVDNAQISNGMRVTAQFDQVAEDAALLRFRRDDAA